MSEINNFTLTKAINDAIRAAPDCAGYVAFGRCVDDDKGKTVTVAIVAPNGDLLTTSAGGRMSSERTVDGLAAVIVGKLIKEHREGVTK
jgi:hypothetical protein